MSTKHTDAAKKAIQPLEAAFGGKASNVREEDGAVRFDLVADERLCESGFRGRSTAALKRMLLDFGAGNAKVTPCALPSDPSKTVYMVSVFDEGRRFLAGR